MHTGLETRKADVAALCRQFGVCRLAVFGSASGVNCSNSFDAADSDLDFLVDLDERDPASYALAYFELKEALESLFGRSVDLVVRSAITNPWFREEVESTQELLYAA